MQVLRPKSHKFIGPTLGLGRRTSTFQPITKRTVMPVSTKKIMQEAQVSMSRSNMSKNKMTGAAGQSYKSNQPAPKESIINKPKPTAWRKPKTNLGTTPQWSSN